jgi:peptidoglycan/xylan/chitin deacetylase (PgdA/CDA1 family)
MRIGTVLLAAVLTAAQAWGGNFVWPEGRKAAVVLTYDDSLASQLDIAIPALDGAGLKGTFVLAGSGIRQQDVARWRAAAANGHELGNHTLFHPCARAKYPMPVQYQVEIYTGQTMLGEIRTMNTMLTAIDGRSEHAFAVPCGDTMLADGTDYLELLRTSGLVRYERDLQWAARLGLDPKHIAAAWFPETATGAEMIEAVKKAERTGQLLVFGFHGIGGDHLKVSAEAHAELLAYLKAHQSTVWVAPFSTVMDYATARR